MPTVNCPACHASWEAPISPSRCKECGKPLPSSASSGDIDLMLKEMVTCRYCKRDCYEEDLQDGNCPSCGKAALADEEEEDEHDGERPADRIELLHVHEGKLIGPLFGEAFLSIW